MNNTRYAHFIGTRLALIVVVLALVVAPLSARAQEPIVVDPQAILQDGPVGIVIPLQDVVNYHCADAAWPVITCFYTEAEVDKFLEPYSHQGDYVRWFGHINYQGTGFTARRDYNDLRSIGWNDTISSIRTLNNQCFEAWTAINYAGNNLRRCSSIPDLRTVSFNDTISSIERD